MINKPLEEIFAMHPAFDKVRPVVAAFNADTKDGAYEIDGKKIVAYVSRYTTSAMPPAKVESHRKHSEIHFTLSGRENLVYTDVDPLKRNGEYVVENDVEFWDAPSNMPKGFIDEKTGMFFNANAGHFPKVAFEGKEIPVVKVVIKFETDVLDNL